MSTGTVRVLHSFPHRLGKSRICTTAWFEIYGAAKAGAEMSVYTGDLVKPFNNVKKVMRSLSLGKFRIPFKWLGTYRTCVFHDYIVASQLPRLAKSIDLVHVWPLGGLQTIRAAKKLHIPTVMERPNAHTRFAYDVVQKECERIGVALPPNHEHAYNEKYLKREELEYQLADYLLCPSEFVAKTFIDFGFPKEKLLRHQYGYDNKVYYVNPEKKISNDGLKVLFVGVCAVRKGLHFALDAWLKSTACQRGVFQIAGGFVPQYQEKLKPILEHPSIHALGHRTDVPELMRNADIIILPSIEEGFPLAIAEGIGSGCVPLVSDACSEACRHEENGLVHQTGNVEQLTEHLTLLDNNRKKLAQFRAKSIEMAHSLTWEYAGARLYAAYKSAINV